MNLTVVMVFVGVGLAWATAPYVCHETGAQTLAFFTTIAAIVVLLEIVVVYAWNGLHPIQEARRVFIASYGDLNKFWSGNCYTREVVKFGLADYIGRHIGYHSLLQDQLAEALKKRTPAALYDTSLFLRLSVQYVHVEADAKIHARFEFEGKSGTRMHGKHAAFVAQFSHGMLTVGRSFDTLYKVKTGVKIAVDEQLPLGSFVDGIASVIAWFVNNDTEVLDCINNRPIVDPRLLQADTERPPKPGPNQIKRSRIQPKAPPAQPSKQLKKRKKK